MINNNIIYERKKIAECIELANIYIIAWKIVNSLSKIMEWSTALIFLKWLSLAEEKSTQKVSS